MWLHIEEAAKSTAQLAWGSATQSLLFLVSKIIKSFRNDQNSNLTNPWTAMRAWSSLETRDLLAEATYCRSQFPKGSSRVRPEVDRFIQTKLPHGGPPNANQFGFARRVYKMAWQRPGLGKKFQSCPSTRSHKRVAYTISNTMLVIVQYMIALIYI